MKPHGDDDLELIDIELVSLTLTNKKILLVDDEIFNIVAARSILESAFRIDRVHQITE
jgi:PleD family two-component response regulator